MDPLDELAYANEHRRLMGSTGRRQKRRGRWIVLLLLMGVAVVGWRYRGTIELGIRRAYTKAEGSPIADLFAREQTAQELFESVSPAVVRVVAEGSSRGFGTGFFISADGLLVTNYHVVEEADWAAIVDGSNAELPVEGIVAANPSVDLVILKVDVISTPYISLSSDDSPPKVGTHVYAIGNPLGLTNSLSEGLVSGVRDVPKLCAIQTTAAISPGSSGGPLLTKDGRVVGVTTAYLVTGQNLNFAVSAKHVKSLLETRGRPRPFPRAGSRR